MELFMNHIRHTCKIFWELLRHDILLILPKLPNHFLNYMVIAPALFTIGVCYLQAPLYFSFNATEFSTLMLPANVIVLLLIIAFNALFDFLWDLEEDRTTNYIITTINYRLLIVQKIIFSALYTFIGIAPFFIIAKLILGPLFDTTNTNWFSLFCVLVCGCLCIAAYYMLAFCFIKIRQLNILWGRCNLIIIILARMPFSIDQAATYYKPLHIIMSINPLSYCTEGLHHALNTTNNSFFSVAVCCGVLLSTTVLCTTISFFGLKRRLDLL